MSQVSPRAILTTERVMSMTEANFHACHLLTNSREQVAAASAYFNEGLSGDEACLLVASRHSIEDWFDQLRAAGIDVELERKRGALDVIADNQQRAPGYLNSMVMVGEV